MATQHLKSIFLSASIPSAERDERFYETADIIAIGDAVRALATVVIPKARLVWGGHPSITPLIRLVMERMNARVQNHVTLYQSTAFEGQYPSDVPSFENIVFTPKLSDEESSLTLMRNTLFEENKFYAGIFIGGMEGVLHEFEMFSNQDPDAIVLPIASTGAAAKLVFDESPGKFDQRLNNDYAYMTLFRDLLKL